MLNSKFSFKHAHPTVWGCACLTCRTYYTPQIKYFCGAVEVVNVFTTFFIARVINTLSTPFQYPLHVTKFLDGPIHSSLTMMFQL